MSTALDIITAAYRESNLTSANQTPTSLQITEALSRLASLVASAYGFEVGGNQLIDWPLGNPPDETSWFIPSWSAEDWTRLDPNIRIIPVTATPFTLQLPVHPLDGARIAVVDPNLVIPGGNLTIMGDTRSIEGAASVTLTTSASRMWFYRADLGDWVRLTEITDPAQTFPFPIDFDDYFICMLAARLNPRYGRALPPETSAAMARSLEHLRARYHQKTPVPTDSGVLALSRGYGRWRTFGWPTRIVRGRARWMT